MLIHKRPSENNGLDDTNLNRDIVSLLRIYFERDAYIDILANIPILVYTATWGFPMTVEETYEYDDY